MAKKEFNRMRVQYGEVEQRIPTEIIKKSDMFDESVKWAEKIKKDYTVLDYGNPTQRSRSEFYEMEKAKATGTWQH